MTQSPDPARDRAEEEAAGWLLRLSEAPDNAALRLRFEAWRQASGHNAEIWARTSRAYDLIGKGTPRHRDHWAPYAAAGCTAPLPLRRKRRVVTGIAAFALAACLLVVAAPRALLHLEADAVTGTAELRTVTLEDGSRLRLAPESAVELAFGDGERRVRLIRGDAFFEVTPDAARPFRVAAGDTVATVLGTAFEVGLGDGSLVAVRHGRVRVEDMSATPPVSADLRAGDWIRIAPAGGATQGKAQPDGVADWLRGELVARNRPAGEIVDALRRYHAGAIVLRADTFARTRVSGIYDLRDPAGTLRDLAASHGAAVTALSPWLLVVTGQ